MTREDILTKAVAIAKRNGFGISDDFFTEVPTENWLQEGQDLYFSIIFCHDFAITFFGEEEVTIDDFDENSEITDLQDYENPAAFLMINRKNMRLPVWQYHLIQMSLSIDPLLYIQKFLEDHEQELN
jgi:hypothetical protein